LKGRGVKLWIIGYGPMEDEIKDKIVANDLASQVVLLGKYDGASSFLTGFDAIVIPSRFEGMPFICLEAMIAKIPIVATPAVGITDLITPDTSYMSGDFTPSSLADAVSRFLLDKAEAPGHIRNKVQENYRLVRSEYSPVNAEKIRALYVEMNSYDK